MHLSAVEISKITQIHLSTIHTYLNGYRFAKYYDIISNKYNVNEDFITELHDFCKKKRKHNKESAERIKQLSNMLV